MQLKKSSSFAKHFKKRILPSSVLEAKFQERLALFLTDRSNPVLRDHKLIGKQGNLRAFSVTGDVRVIYILVSDDLALFVDIGSHNQVYEQ
jgi:mRNA-degrading endonuclease YafQ of YafQ-DinJ toxin-antitoxin module